MRVLQLIKSLGRGGAEMLLVEGLRTADRSRFDYSYGHFLPWKNALEPALRSLNVQVTCFHARTNLDILLAAWRVADHIRIHRIDLLHCHLPMAGAVGRVAGRLTQTPVLYTEHNEQERYHPLTRRLNAWTWRLQTSAIAVSEGVAASIQRNIDGARDRDVQVVLNGVDTSHFARSLADRRAARSNLGIPEDAAAVGTVAVFRAQKRLDDWISAAARIRHEIPDVRFLIVGDGPLRSTVQAAIARNNLEAAVLLPGLCDDVRPYLAALDVYMMSSVFEGLPVALLEAMSMSCVPVCTDVGGIRQVVRDGWNGRLVPARLPTALADAAVRVLQDPVSMRSMAAAARRDVEEHFSLQRMTRQLEAIYIETAARWPR